VNYRSGITAVGVSFGLAALLIIPNSGLAQNLPGYRMRLPTGSSFSGTVPSVRPPRLVGSPDRSLTSPGGVSRRQNFFPYQDFGWYFAGSDGYGYAEDPDSMSATYPTKAEPARDVYPVFDSVPEPGPLEVASRRVGSKIVLRLAWRDNGLAAMQVAFFLADSAKTVLSAQTDRAPPFTAQFEPPPGTAFAGMTVVLPNGTLVTRFVPYKGTP
jgi:hypothetical protein